MSKTILKLNVSAIKGPACALRLHYDVIDGYKETLNNNDIEFGQAFHLFVKTMKLTKGDYAVSTEAARQYFNRPTRVKKGKEWLTENYLVATCFAYWEAQMRDGWTTVVRGPERTPVVECKFAIPYYADEHTEVILCGTIDDICQRGPQGMFAIRDYKTTSVWNKDEYLANYRLSAQLKFYRFILKRYAQLYPDSIFHTIDERPVGVFIQGIFLGKDKPATFEISEVFVYSEQEMTEFESMLKTYVLHFLATLDFLKNTGLKHPLREGTLNGACHTQYGMCKYALACGAVDEVARGHVLRNNFIQVPYDPLNLHE